MAEESIEQIMTLPTVEKPVHAEIATSEQIARRKILESIARHGLLRPNRASELGLTPSKSSSGGGKELLDENRISGVVILDDSTDVIRTPHRSPLDGKHDFDTIEFSPTGATYYSTRVSVDDPNFNNLRVKTLRNALYAPAPFAILPVLTERANESHGVARATLNNKTLEERMINSIVVLANLGDIPINCQNSEDAFTEADIDPKKLQAVLAPEVVYDDALIIFKDLRIPVMPVITKEMTLSFGLDNRAESIVRKLKIPDYESALNTFMDNHHEPLFVHGVRLPTKADMQSAM